MFYLQSVHRDAGGYSWNFQTSWKIYTSLRSKTRWLASSTQISFNSSIHYQGRCIHRMFLWNIPALETIFRDQSSKSKRVQLSNSFKKQTFKNTWILLQNYSLGSKLHERASRQSSDTYNRRSLLSKLDKSSTESMHQYRRARNNWTLWKNERHLPKENIEQFQWKSE